MTKRILIVLTLLLGSAIPAFAQHAVTNSLTNIPRDPKTITVEERKDDVVRRIAVCESGGYGPSSSLIFGGGGQFIGRLQFMTRTVIGYIQKRDGIALNPKDAIELAHDYDRAAELAKYMIFELGEYWHWPVCAKRANAKAVLDSIRKG